MMCELLPSCNEEHAVSAIEAPLSHYLNWNTREREGEREGERERGGREREREGGE